MQTRALHSLAIIPRNLHGVPHPIQFRVDLSTLPDHARYTTETSALCTMPRSHPNTALIYAPVRAPLRRQQCKARIHNWPRRLRIALCYNFSLFVIALLLFHCLLPVIATDRAHRTPYTYAVLLLPARNPTNSSICIRIANRRVPLCDPHLHFARFARDIYAISPQKPIHARFCRRTAARHPVLPLSAPSIPASGAGERISLCSRFMWNTRLVIHQNLNVYRGFCSFMHIYTLRHCMFFAYPFAFSAPAILSPLPLRG